MLLRHACLNTAGVGAEDWGELAAKAAIRGMQDNSSFSDQASSSWGTGPIAAGLQDPSEAISSAPPVANGVGGSHELDVMPLAL